MVKICSFDVGIKNLAYCVMTKQNDKNKNVPFTIEKWGVINFDSGNITCGHTLQNKNTTCTKNASHMLALPNEEPSYCCSSHKTFLTKKLETFMNENDSSKIQTDAPKCTNVMKTGKLCNKKAEYVNKNCCLCKVHLKSLTSIKKVKSLACHKKPIENICVNLINILEDKYLFLSDVDEVIIENQPININGTTVGTMKSVACFLMSYFTMKSKNGSVNNVKFISPTNKLSIDKEQTDDKLKEGNNKKEVYDLTKELGIEYTHLILEHYKLEDEKKIWDSYKDKQDDLCDSFLQGFHYLFFKDNLSKYSCVDDGTNIINIDVMKNILRQGAKNITERKENKIKQKQENAIKKEQERILKEERKKIREEKRKLKNDEKIVVKVTKKKRQPITDDEL